MPPIPATLDERIAAVEVTLDVRGVVALPPNHWPGATGPAIAAALANFREVVDALGLEEELLDDGTRIAYRAKGNGPPGGTSPTAR